MKRIAVLVLTVLSGSCLWAQISPSGAKAVQSQVRTAVQGAPAKAAPAPIAKKAAPITAQPARIPADVHAVAVQQAPKHPQPTVKKASTKPVAKPAVKTSTTEAPKVKEAMVKNETPVPAPQKIEINATGRRDPFTSPIVRTAMGFGPPCGAGKRCLVVNDMVLRGIVRSPDGMIAVVENNSKRAYFLRENDPVFHGVVVKISGDSVVFREDIMDPRTGKVSTHEVTKHVNAPVV